MTEFSFLAKTIPLRLSYMSGHNASEFIQIPGSIGSKNKHPKGQQLTEHFVFGKKKSTEKKKKQLAVPHILSRPVCSGIEQGEWKRVFLKSPFHWSGPYMLSRSTRGLFWRSLWKAVSLSGSLFKDCRWGSFWNSGEKISSALSGTSLSREDNEELCVALINTRNDLLSERLQCNVLVMGEILSLSYFWLIIFYFSPRVGFAGSAHPIDQCFSILVLENPQQCTF